MTDVFDQAKRSDVMSRIRSKHTKPEVVVRKLLHSLGYRFRLHSRTLPGKPDLVLRKHSTVINVKGCFWHCHTCIDGHTPKSRLEYWKPKLEGNVARDKRNAYELRKLGWRVIVVWECETRDPEKLARRLSRLLPR